MGAMLALSPRRPILPSFHLVEPLPRIGTSQFRWRFVSVPTKKGSRVRKPILCVLVTAQSACATVPPQASPTAAQVVLAVYPSGTIITTSRIGRFYTAGNCLLFRDNSGRAFLPVLKSGSSLTGQTVSIAGSVNKRTVRISDRVVLEGDGQDWSNVPASYGLSTYKELCSVPPFFVINAK